MIIGITGYARSGKDTVAKHLIDNYGYKRKAFADPIRDFLYEIDPHLDGPRLRTVVDDYGWEVAKANPLVRELLQNTGVAARKLFGKQFWVNQAFAGVYQTDKLVITDVRFKNEAEAIKNANGVIWRVVRSGIGPVNSHISETELDDIQADKIIINNAGMNGLVSQIDLFMGK